MELFQSLRLNIGAAKLEKKLAVIKRKKSFTSFRNVKRIGIVWDASCMDDFSYLSGFIQKMSSRNIIVDVLGYFPGKELPDKYTAVRYLKCFKKNEINFFFAPVSNEAYNFIDTQFDILIDLNFKKQFPLSYVTSLSSAKFKVGLFEDSIEKSPFDLMMEMKDLSDIENYLSQVIYYLEMINGSGNSLDKSVQSIKN
jgi:hypothetical protein